MQETWVWSLGQEDPLEEEMATHTTILAWEIPWTEEPDGLQFIGLQRGWHNLVTKQQKLFFGIVSVLVFTGGSDGKASAYNAGHPGSIPGSGRSPGERKW